MPPDDLQPIDTVALRRAVRIATERGERDARRAVQRAQVKASARTASAAGLLALFPGLRARKP